MPFYRLPVKLTMPINTIITQPISLETATLRLASGNVMCRPLGRIQHTQ
jgi:hypothetical protein